MPKSDPFCREAGTGPGVVCLHANASASGQWRPLMELLASEYHVLAADSYGAGNSPPRPTDRPASLSEEIAFLEPVFARAGAPLALVGHSYGGAIALIAAVVLRHRVSALALFEPTLFAVVDAASPPPNDADGIRTTVARAAAALDAGDSARSAEIFIDFWMGPGAWATIPKSRKPPIVAAVANVRDWANALFHEPTPLETFRELDIPVLYMMGSDSPLSSLAVGRLLTKVLPQVRVVEFEGVGHMGPVTDSRIINDAILGFLRQVLPSS